VKNQDSMGKTNFFFSTLPFSPWSILASKNTGKLNSILVLNKTSIQVHTKLNFDMLGVHKKLMKYVVHSSKRKKLKKIIFFAQVAQIVID
jgi:hypothetical protein